MSLLSKALLIFTFFPFPGTAHLRAQAPAAAGDSADTQSTAQIAVEKVMADFHEAVVAHDWQRIAALSVPEGSTWFNVLLESAYNAAKAKNPAVQQVRRSSFAEFAKFVSSTSAALNPQHTNIQIHTDGTIASVYFKYVFLIAGKAQNQG